MRDPLLSALCRAGYDSLAGPNYAGERVNGTDHDQVKALRNALYSVGYRLPDPDSSSAAWVPVPIRWRHVVAGDVIVAPNDAPWLIAARGPDSTVNAMRTANERHDAPVDPDETVQVLMPVTERDAVELTRAQLGARLVQRRTA